MLVLHVESDSGVAIAKHSGPFGAEEVKESIAALWRFEGWSGRSVVWDLSEALFDLTPSDIREIAQFVLEGQPTPPEKVACVSPGDVEFGMSRMFEVYRQDPQTAFRVFRNFDEALAWARSPGPD